MLHFHSIKVKEIRKETADCISIVFDIPEELKNTFTYQAGQYLTLRVHIKGEEIRRSYSLCSSPLEREWRIAVKKLDAGIFSAYASEQLKVGDTLDVMSPMGSFRTDIHSDNKKDYVGIAAGSGITPIISIIKTILQIEPQSSFTLVYGNRSRHSIIFKEELEALKNKYIHRFRIIHILSREITDAPINSGRIDAAKCNTLFTKAINLQADEFFICGPEELIFCVKDFLNAKGIDRTKIHFELFASPNSQKLTVNNPQSIIGDATFKSKVTVMLDGRSFQFNLSHEAENILDAALQHGADLPYSCKGGVCSTCRAKLVEGEVDMDVNYALEPEEVEQGFILTCQSHPRTEKVVVDFDAK